MTNKDIWRLSATETVARTHAGDLSAESSIGASISRMNEANPALNAVVVDLSNEALERAHNLDTPASYEGLRTLNLIQIKIPRSGSRASRKSGTISERARFLESLRGPKQLSFS